ncbi:hypothetical protein PAHAL_9G169300 [Panicum hallii]|uniref:Uncharacterized protein n=1 Tax=Panicum hallii TaxID=206008 RepID=A0A2T8I1G1_9POAL|nr:hypothetical protein PAHAL_9G169300 [Panicum hallii]
MKIFIYGRSYKTADVHETCLLLCNKMSVETVEQRFCRSSESCWRRVCFLLDGHLTFGCEGSCTDQHVFLQM